MNARSMRNRLLRVERKIRPLDDTGFTLEQLCGAMWREDKRNFSKIAKGTNLSLFVLQFELDDVERGGADRDTRRRE
jgi:hypothetical protein